LKTVCITGVGLVSSLGVGRDAHLPLGERVLDTASFAPWPVHPMPALDMATAIPRKEMRQMENFQRLGTYTAGLALADAEAAGLVAGMDLVVAAGGGERDTALDEAILAELDALPPEAREAHVHHRLANGLRPTLFLAQLPNLLAGSISIVHGVAGSSRTLMGEEGAGAEAVRVAAARVAAGTSAMVLVGAASQPARWETLLTYAPFLHSGAWCPAAERAGMVPGAQAAFLVLEDAAHAAARGARVLARLGDVRVDAGVPEGRAARFAALSAEAGLSVSPCAGGFAPLGHPGDEWLADALGAGLEAAFVVGVALAAWRGRATSVHGFGHDYAEFSARLEPA
jgi:3-oxoacyl-[acyl-carrier-protein] synthase II